MLTSEVFHAGNALRSANHCWENNEFLSNANNLEIFWTFDLDMLKSAFTRYICKFRAHDFICPTKFTVKLFTKRLRIFIKKILKYKKNI